MAKRVRALVKLPESVSTICSIWLSMLLVVAIDLAASEDQGGSMQKPPHQVSTDSTYGPQQATTIAQPTQQIALVRLTVPYAFKHVNAGLERARVKCALFSDKSPPSKNQSLSYGIAHGSADINIQGKDTAGEVEIIIRRGEGIYPHGYPEAHSYQCKIMLLTNGAEVEVLGLEPDPYAWNGPAWATPAPDSTLTVNGLLNQ